MAKKARVDQLLVEQGLFPSRARAQAAVMAGLIFSGGQRVDKAGTMVALDTPLEVRGKDCPYVSRGGLKLERALRSFSLEVAGLRAVDLGSSTGGFSDCLLQHGVAHVVAVDVGKGQLDIHLRQDSRVTVMEETNARYLEPHQLPYPAELVTADLAFISLRLVFPVIRSITAPEAVVVCLIKPQFECGPRFLRKGVVRDPQVHLAVLRQVLGAAWEEGLCLAWLTHSPIKGPAGNIEYLAGFRCLPENPQQPGDWDSRLIETVETAHRELNQT